MQSKPRLTKLMGHNIDEKTACCIQGKTSQSQSEWFTGDTIVNTSPERAPVGGGGAELVQTD